MESTPTLAELLRQDISPDFPISKGNSRSDDPLIITGTLDYVAVEYRVIRYVMSALGEEWEKSGQHLYERDGRVIDEIVTNAKETGAPEWQYCRRFYFDITIGFRKLGT